MEELGESLTERNMAPCSSQSFSPGLLQITFNEGRCFCGGSLFLEFEILYENLAKPLKANKSIKQRVVRSCVLREGVEKLVFFMNLS